MPRMTTPDPVVTVIIPTLGLRKRAACLRAAIHSALDQRGVATCAWWSTDRSAIPSRAQPAGQCAHCARRARCSRGGLDPKLRVCDSSHTNISVLLAAGEQSLTVSKSVGHKRAKMTLAVYGHAFKSDRRSTVVLDKEMALWRWGNSRLLCITKGPVRMHRPFFIAWVARVVATSSALVSTHAPPTPPYSPPPRRG